MSVLAAYRALPLPWPQFAQRYWLPLGLGGLAAAVLGLVLAPLAPGVGAWLAPMALLGTAAMALVLPALLRDRERVRIDHAMHLYVTHLGVLSTTNLPRNAMLRVLAERREYGPLAAETRRLLHLVEEWNVSLPQACLIVARGTPSKLFADFLERMAHILESSGDLEAFLHSEQDVVLKEYASVYQGAVQAAERLQQVYLSLMMSGVFMVVFALVLPPLTGADPAVMLPPVLAVFVLLEAMLAFVLHLRAPPDRLWTDSDILTAERLDVRLALPIAAALALFLLAALWASTLPKGWVLGLAASPLLLCGLPASRVEQLIKRREANYPAFLRSLGASVAARGGGATEVLRRLARHDFGPVTPLIKNLQRRLALRLDEGLAWRHFGAETGSRLVNEFNDLYVETVRAGGRADAVAGIISDNFLRLGALRRARYDSAAAIRGVVLGLTAAMAFTLFVGLEVVGLLAGLFAQLPQADVGLALGFAAPLDLEALRLLLLLMMVAHAGLAAMMLKVADGGAWTEGCTMFVVMVWVAVLASEASRMLMGTMFQGAGP